MKTSYLGLAIAFLAIGSLALGTRFAAATANAIANDSQIDSNTTISLPIPADGSQASTVTEISPTHWEDSVASSLAANASGGEEDRGLLSAMQDGDDEVPVDDDVATLLPGQATLCGIDWSSTNCPQGLVPTQCPTGPQPTRCPFVGETPSTCPDKTIATACPAGQLVPTNCGGPFGVIPTHCPTGTTATVCAGGVQPTLCAGGVPVSTLCPNGVQIPTQCGIYQIPTICSEAGETLPTVCPSGDIIPSICPGLIVDPQ